MTIKSLTDEQEEFCYYLLSSKKDDLANALLEGRVEYLPMQKKMELNQVSLTFKTMKREAERIRLNQAMALITTSGWGRGHETEALQRWR